MYSSNIIQIIRRIITYFSVLLATNGLLYGKQMQTTPPHSSNYKTQLEAKLKNLKDSPNILPFNGEIVIAKDRSIIVQQIIRTVDHIPWPSKPNRFKYCIASLTKQITAALILKAVEEKKLRLNDMAQQHLNPADVDDLSHPKYQATIHQLLSHTSGFIDGQTERICQPGTQFHYASWSYVILGQILVNIYHKPFSDLANTLFRDLGMHHSQAPERAKVSELRQQDASLIKGYHYNPDNTFVETDPEIGGNQGAAGGVIATIEDLVIWNQALHRGDLLPPSSYHKMTTSYSQNDHSVFGNLGYGYGLQITTTAAGVEYSHLGHIPGYQTMLLYYPKSEITVVVLINSDRLGQDQDPKAKEHLRLIRQIAIDIALQERP